MNRKRIGFFLSNFFCFIDASIRHLLVNNLLGNSFCFGVVGTIKDRRDLRLGLSVNIVNLSDLYM